jgi:hypothetical protein
MNAARPQVASRRLPPQARTPAPIHRQVTFFWMRRIAIITRVQCYLSAAADVLLVDDLLSDDESDDPFDELPLVELGVVELALFEDLLSVT